MNSAASHGSSTAVPARISIRVIETTATVELCGGLTELPGSGDTDELATEVRRQRAHRAAGTAADVEDDVVGGDLGGRRQPQRGRNSEHVHVIDRCEHVGREIVDVVPGRRDGAQDAVEHGVVVRLARRFRRRPHREPDRNEAGAACRFVNRDPTSAMSDDSRMACHRSSRRPVARSLGGVTLRRGPKRPLSKKVAPTRSIEKELWELGYPVVVGIDEVGRGAWAGPLSVGAAVLPLDRRLNGIRDSKMLTEGDRERLFDRVASWCATWGVGHASQIECDELGMAAAQRLAAGRAIAQLSVVPDAAIVDGSWDFVSPHVRHVERVIKADATVPRRGRRQHSRQGQSRPADAGRRRALPGVVVRQQQGLSVPDPPRCPPGLGPVADPPAVVGVHGSLRAVDRHPTCAPTRARCPAVVVRRVRRTTR